tara:strand:- start:11306 stop:11455 length:150 start_codon:yes stop_codon:yes gene_type:complete
MTKIKAYMADHDEIATTLSNLLQFILVFGVCLGTAPALIWVASQQFALG